MGCHSLLQGGFLTQGPNLGLLLCGRIFLPSELPVVKNPQERLTVDPVGVLPFVLPLFYFLTCVFNKKFTPEIKFICLLKLINRCIIRTWFPVMCFEESLVLI